MGIISLLVTFWLGYLIVKKYKPQPVLFMAGLILMFHDALWFRDDSTRENTGLVLFDAFEFIKKTFSSRAAGLGLNKYYGGRRFCSLYGSYRLRVKALVSLTIKPLLTALPYIMCLLLG